MSSLCLVRHGQSLWNKENKFTGWIDIDLTEEGKLEAQKSGEFIKKGKYNFDIAYTSILIRANHTLDIILKEINQSINIINSNLSTYSSFHRFYYFLMILNELQHLVSSPKLTIV